MESPSGGCSKRSARARLHRSIDVEPTLVTAHSDKDGAPTFKRGFGFHPLLAYLDCPGHSRWRGGCARANAGANTAADHIAVVSGALEQLPRAVVEQEQILVRTDSAGATHELLDFCHDGRIRYSVGFDITQAVREAILALPERAWRPAINQDGEPRSNGQVVELAAPSTSVAGLRGLG